MYHMLIRILIAASLMTAGSAASCLAASPAATPFYSFNQSPLVQIFGLPAAESATVQQRGQYLGLVSLDVANNYSGSRTAHELILLDGESYRLNLALRYGIGNRLELGADLPLVGYSGGILDGLIESWHSIFGLEQGGRLQAPRNRLLFSYQEDGRQRLLVDRDNFGIGDLRLNAGWQLYEGGESARRALALRASLKLPTGSSSRLRGSGSTDLALWLTGSNDYPFSEGRMHFGLFAAGGLLALSDGDILRDRQNNLVGFGSLGAGWSPRDWIAFKSQVSLHTPFYRSSLREMGDGAVQLLVGGTLAFSPKTALDLGVSEDVRVSTSPDFGLHLGLSHQF